MNKEEKKKEIKKESTKRMGLALLFSLNALTILIFSSGYFYLESLAANLNSTKTNQEQEKAPTIKIESANFEKYRTLLVEKINEKITEYNEKCIGSESLNCIEEESKQEILETLNEFKENINEISEDELGLFIKTKDEVEVYLKKLESEDSDIKEDETSSNEEQESEEKTDNDENSEEETTPTSTITPKPSATPKPSSTPTPSIVPKPSSNPTPSASTQPTNDLENILNNAKLNPLKTGYPELDSRVEKVLNEATTSSMTTYQKVKSIYNWVINNMSYQMGFIIENEIDTLVNEYAFYENDAIEIFLANNALATKKGSCDNYSAIFMIIMRRIGLDSYTVGARNKDGSGHTTVNIKINDTWYNFDTQGDDNSQKNGKIMYYYFGKTDAESSKLYTYINRNNDVSEFKKFAKQQSALQITISVLGKKYSAKAVDKNDYISEVIDVDYSKNYPIPIKIEASEEVNYKWLSTNTTYTYYNWEASTIKGQGTMKSGELEFGYNYATRQYMTIHFTDSKGRELNFVLRFNFRDPSKELSLKIGNYSCYVSSWYDFNVYGSNGIGELTYSAKIIDTNDPQGISSIKISPTIPKGSAYTNFQLTNINWEKYYYTVEISVTDASGKTVTMTTTNETKKEQDKSMKNLLFYGHYSRNLHLT